MKNFNKKITWISAAAALAGFSANQVKASADTVTTKYFDAEDLLANSVQISSDSSVVIVDAQSELPALTDNQENVTLLPADATIAQASERLSSEVPAAAITTAAPAASVVDGLLSNVVVDASAAAGKSSAKDTVVADLTPSSSSAVSGVSTPAISKPAEAAPAADRLPSTGQASENYLNIAGSLTMTIAAVTMALKLNKKRTY
jgi:hypothetical protein